MRTLTIAFAIMMSTGVIEVPQSSDWTEPLDPLVPRNNAAMFTPAVEALRKEYHAQDIRYRLLAWHIMVNDRGLKVEAGLLWLDFRAVGVESWALADVYRHPHQGPTWQLSYVTDTPWRPLKVFPTKPTNGDVYEFGARHWAFGDPPPFFQYVAAHVCEHAWAEVIGTAPEKRYPSERLTPSKGQPNGVSVHPSSCAVGRQVTATGARADAATDGGR